MFNLPHVSTKGYETKQLVGASSAISTDAQKLNAVNELLRWYKQKKINKRKLPYVNGLY